MSTVDLLPGAAEAPGEDGPVWRAVLREPGTRRVVWHCNDDHPAKPGARACARGELAQRAMPEMRGNWDGWTHSIRDCQAPGGHRQMPVCPMCAKGLMHTQREHELVEKSIPAKELKA